MVSIVVVSYPGDPGDGVMEPVTVNEAVSPVEAVRTDEALGEGVGEDSLEAPDEYGPGAVGIVAEAVG